jgi:maleylpyruvate isomerase
MKPINEEYGHGCMFDHVTSDPLALTEDLRRADDRLLETITGLTPESISEPSLLPGWTRGHVLSHLARNADALGNLLTWARTGVETRAYASPEARAAGIEAGAARPLTEQLADVSEASARFLAAAVDMPPEAWAYVFDAEQGSAAKVVWRRLREVEVHHVDLGVGYTTKDWPDAFTARLLRGLVTERPRASGDDPIVAVSVDDGPSWQIGSGTPDVHVSGTAQDLAGWLAGRSPGTSLTVSPNGPLPPLSAWM